MHIDMLDLGVSNVNPRDNGLQVRTVPNSGNMYAEPASTIL